MSKENLVVCYKQDPVDEVLIGEIHAAWPHVNIVNVGQKDVVKALHEADYFCGHVKVSINWDEIVKIGRLRWIQSSAAGMDWCLVPSVIDSNIVITTASGALADQVAEHALALILASLRSVAAFFADQFVKTDGYRSFTRLATADLTGKTVGIVGFGGVGRRLSQLLAPFRTRILATDLFPESKPDHVEQLFGPDNLDRILKESDIVVLCLPLNDTTKRIFNAEKFGMMKQGSLFVNVARGPIVATEDLIESLKIGKLGGAVVDVTDPEPLPKNHPLWDAPNVLITPHVAGQSALRFATINRLFLENIRRRQTGQPFVNRLSDEGKRLGFPLRNGETPLWIDIADNLK